MRDGETLYNNPNTTTMGIQERIENKLELLIKVSQKNTILLNRIIKNKEIENEIIFKEEISKILNVTVRTFGEKWKEYRDKGCPIYKGLSGRVEGKRGAIHDWYSIYSSSSKSSATLRRAS